MGSPKNSFVIYCSAPDLLTNWQQNCRDYFYMQSTASSQHKHVSTIYRQSQVINRDILEPKLFCSMRAGVATSIETCTRSNIVKLLNTYCVYVEKNICALVRAWIWNTFFYFLQVSRKTLLCRESQSYKLLRIFFLLRHHFIGVDHIRLGRLTIEVQRIFKGGQGNQWNRGLFIEKVSNGHQCGNTSNDQNNHQASAGTPLRIITSRRSCKTREYIFT